MAFWGVGNMVVFLGNIYYPKPLFWKKTLYLIIVGENALSLLPLSCAFRRKHAKTAESAWKQQKAAHAANNEGDHRAVPLSLYWQRSSRWERHGAIVTPLTTDGERRFQPLVAAFTWKRAFTNYVFNYTPIPSILIYSFLIGLLTIFV